MKVVWLLLTFLFCVTYTEGLKRCLQCSHVTDPSMCTTATICRDDEDCKVEQYISLAGTMYYSSGCMSKTWCAALGKRAPDTLETPPSSDILTCRECCSDEFCNNQGCGIAAPVRTERGPYCFECSLLSEPEDCRILRACAQDEACVVYEDVVTGSSGGKLYSSTCIHPSNCQLGNMTTVPAVGRRHSLTGRQDSDLCRKCCNQDFCNDNCPQPSTPPPTTTPIPTTTTTSAPSTTTTTMTTTTLATTTQTSTTTLPTTTTVNKAALCSLHGYHYVASAALCYKFHYSKVTWSAANNACKQEGGLLAIIDTDAKWASIRGAIQHDTRYSHQRVFIGLSDSRHHDNFRWPDGSALHHAHWAHNEPDKTDGDCVAIDTSDHYLWHDTDCSHHYMFVCTKRV